MLWHKDRDLQRRRLRHPARRVRVRRLPACGSCRSVCAADGVGGRVRECRRPGLGDLQRVSDPLRGASAAGGADAQQFARVSLRSRRGCALRRVDTVFTAGCARGDVLQIPVSHGEGRYVADEATLDMLERDAAGCVSVCAAGRVARSTTTSPNGSMHDIAGIVNERRNVLGMMPHPERACEPLLGSSDGMRLFSNVAKSVSGNGVMPVAAVS